MKQTWNITPKKLRQLTLKQRLKVYTNVLNVLKTEGPYYVCILLDEEYAKIVSKAVPYGEKITETHFPEFFEQKPKNKSISDSWWLPLDSESRIKALKKAIKLVEKKIQSAE